LRHIGSSRSVAHANQLRCDDRPARNTTPWREDLRSLRRNHGIEPGPTASRHHPGYTDLHMAKKKRPRLTPELERQYREWLKARGLADVSFTQDVDGEVHTPAPSGADGASVEAWLREANIGDVGFDESGSDDIDEEETPATSATAKSWWSDWRVIRAIALVAAIAAAMMA
jgi:hypothetical protein